MIFKVYVFLVLLITSFSYYFLVLYTRNDIRIFIKKEKNQKLCSKGLVLDAYEHNEQYQIFGLPYIKI